MIKNAIKKINSFNRLCFEGNDVEMRELVDLKNFKSIEIDEKLFKLLLLLSEFKENTKEDINCYLKEQLLDVEKRLSSSQFIEEVVSCKLKDVFKIENFCLSSLTKEFENLYFQDVLNEFDDDHLTQSKKSKKKKRKRKKKNKKLFNSFTIEENTDNKSEIQSETILADSEKDQNILNQELKSESYLGETEKDEIRIVNKQTRSVSDVVILKPKIKKDEVINIYSAKMLKIEAREKLSNKTGIGLKSDPKKLKSHFIKKEHEIKENISVRDVKAIKPDDKNLSLENYVLIEQDTYIRTDNKYSHRKHEQLPGNRKDTLTSKRKLEKDFDDCGVEEINKIKPYFGNFQEEKPQKPISLIDKGPFHFESVKRTSSTELNKKKVAQNPYRINDEYNSISINKTISTGADSRKFGRKKEIKNINIYIPFNLKELKKNNSEMEEDGFCVTPIELDGSKKDKKEKKEEFLKNRSTEHKKKSLYILPKNQKMIQHKKTDIKKRKPKLKKITKDNRNIYRDRGKNNNEKITKIKRESGERGKKKKQGQKNSKIKANPKIKSLSKWGEEETLPMINMTKKTSIQSSNQKKKIEKKYSLKDKRNSSTQLSLQRPGMKQKKLIKKQIQKTRKTVFYEKMNVELKKVTDNLVKEAEKLDEGRIIILDRINSIVRKTFNSNDLTVQGYGSYITRLLTPFSDMDLAIRGCFRFEKEQAIQMLEVLSDNLRLFSFIKKVKVILTASVPVIKLIVDPSVSFEAGDKTKESFILHIDIIVDLYDGFNPISTPMRTTDYILHCIKSFPSFFRNMLFLKFALTCNGLSNSYTGGLNSYGLNILYVAYLKRFGQEENGNHFELLLGFLKFISSDFNYQKEKICYGILIR